MGKENWYIEQALVVGCKNIGPVIVDIVQTVDIHLAVYAPGSTSAPFGNFDTPINGSTVSGSIPVTGWVLDDIGVTSVTIYRQDGGGDILIGDAVFVDGTRPDVEALEDALYGSGLVAEPLRIARGEIARLNSQ